LVLPGRQGLPEERQSRLIERRFAAARDRVQQTTEGQGLERPADGARLQPADRRHVLDGLEAALAGVAAPRDVAIDPELGGAQPVVIQLA